MTQRRIRSTWNIKASPAPAMPSEAGAHPASQPDPGVEDYGTGYPSDWAEDPHPGPYGDTPAPAMPSEAGGHPAARTAAEAQMRYAAEKKAFDCVMIAERLLGSKAPENAIQRQAMAFMHMEDDMISDTLDNMAMYDDIEDEDEYGMEMFASDDEADDEDEGKTASARKTADEMLAEMLAEYTASDDEDEDDDHTASDDEDDDEGGKEADQNDPDDDTLSPDVSDEVEDAEEEAGKSASGFDPMGLDGQTVTAEDLFNEYFGGHTASDDEDDDEEGKEASSRKSEEEEAEEEGKTASQRPRPRKPSQGPKTLGKVASTGGMEDPLASIWETAPDVSEAFGMKPRG